MKNPQRIAAIGICAMLAITVIGVIISSIVSRGPGDDDSSATSDTTLQLSPAQLYQQEAASISLLKDLSLKVTVSTEITVGEETFSERSEQSLLYKGIGTGNMTALMDESLTIGDYGVFNSENYADNMLYVTVGGGSFCAPITEADFYKRYTPAILFDTTLYESITASEKGSITVLNFDTPSSAENWALPEGASFQSASGLATLDQNGKLTMSTYDIVYTLGSATFKKHIQITILNVPVSIPSHDSTAYTKIEHPDAPLMLEKACGYLMQSQSVTANIKDMIVCDAFGDNRTQDIHLDLYGRDSKFMAKMELSSLLVNSSRGGEETIKNEQMLFRDGEYSITVDGGAPQVNTNVTAQDMRTSCQDFLVSTILLPRYISGTKLRETENTYEISFSGNDALGQTMCRSACDILYQDSELLISLSSSETTNDLGAYIEVDKYTGLPIASGIFYNGTYVIDGHSYQLHYQTDQTYSAVSTTAYDSITG